MKNVKITVFLSHQTWRTYRGDLVLTRHEDGSLAIIGNQTIAAEGGDRIERMSAFFSAGWWTWYEEVEA